MEGREGSWGNRVVALVPMREHSERVPGKNYRSFAGNPLFHRIISVLEDSQSVDRILINTDSNSIAEDATRCFKKVIIIRRPLDLRGDAVPMNAIIGYDIMQCDADHFLQSHSTNPLLTKATIEKAIDEYFASLKDGYDSLFSVTKIQSRLYWSTGEPINHNPRELLRTQDLPPVFEENSNLYLFSRSSFGAAGSKRIGLKPKMFIINKLEAIDIDEEEDFCLAEALYAMRKRNEC